MGFKLALVKLIIELEVVIISTVQSHIGAALALLINGKVLN